LLLLLLCCCCCGCRAPDKLEIQLSAEDLAAFRAEFIAAVTESLEGSGRFDPEGQRALNTHTVLNVVALA
jgi:hypothetical protein